MATDIILRSVKAAALTHAEMDQNWQSLASTVDIHSASATLAITDQNKIIETNIASGTMTLPTVANAAGTDTDSFKITIKNINATSVIVDGNGAELIEGAASVTLLQYEAAEFTLDGAGTGWVVASYYGPNLVGITSTPTEINKLDGFTGVVADLNIISGGNAAGVSPTEFQYLNGVTSAIQTQLDTKLIAASNLSDLASAATSRSNLGVDAAGTDNSTDVTLAGTPNYITLAGQAITRALINLTSHVTGTLPLANGGTAATTAAAARTSLGVDAAGTDNSTDVTLAGTPDYITLSGQAITRGLIVLTTDVSGLLPGTNLAIGSTQQTFTASGTFTAKVTGTHTIMIISGGGGGGGASGGNTAGYGTPGGGGGGGINGDAKVFTQSLTASTGYTVTVGAGGAGGTGTADSVTGGAGTAGGDSVFDSTTLPGGTSGAGGVAGGSAASGSGTDGLPYGKGGAGGATHTVGSAGSTASGGGGGGLSDATITTTGANGGAGGAGMVIVLW